MKMDHTQTATGLSQNLLLLVLALLLGSDLKSSAATSSVTLQWDASVSTDVTNYTVYYGLAPTNYTFTNNVGTNLINTVSNLTVGERYYFAVTAKNSAGIESDPSQGIRYTGGNTWPTISMIIDSGVAPNTLISPTSTGPVGFTVGDAETAAGSLKLSKGSSIPTLVPVNNIVFGGSGSSRTVNVTPAIGKSGKSTITVSVSDGELTTSTNFILTVDSGVPALNLASVMDNSRTTNGFVTITGAGTNKSNMALVIYSINDEPFQVATAAGNSTFQANLMPGTNKVRLAGNSSQGKPSRIYTRTLFYVVTNGITLATNGAGVISGVVNRRLLEVGRGYQLMAVPKPGNLFSNWTAGNVVLGTNPVLNFQMISNLVLQANFVTNNFMARKGVYTGLAYDTNNVTFTNAGFFRLTLMGRGGFSGVVLLAGTSHPFTGRFWVDGRATVRIARPGKPALTNQLSIDLVGNSGISGTMSDGFFTVPLQADKAEFVRTNPAPYAGRYTMIVPGTGEVAGDGVGNVNMSLGGSGVLGGTLADGTVIVRTAPVSRDGWWPLYAPLYTGKGMLISWVQFETNGTKRMNGDAVWTKNPMPGRYYTNGFVLQTTVEGSQYVAPGAGPTNRVMNLTNGTVILTGGNLGLGVTISETAVLTNNNVLLITGTTGMKLTINRDNGMVNGSFTHPESKQVTPIKAVVQQGQTNIQGFFRGTNQSGRVLLLP